MGRKSPDTQYIAWAVASEDIVDALKNKATRTNILVILGFVAVVPKVRRSHR